MKKHIHTLLIPAAGMALGYLLAVHVEARLPRALAFDGEAYLSTKGLEVVDAQDRRRMLAGLSAEGSPAVWFFDEQGRSRLNIGVYGDGNAMLVLNDENGQAVQIFRTVGPENAPYLIMKSQGRDRIIMGLKGANHDPFLVLFDENGEGKTVFGSY